MIINTIIQMIQSKKSEEVMSVCFLLGSIKTSVTIQLNYNKKPRKTSPFNVKETASMKWLNTKDIQDQKCCRLAIK